MKTPEDYFLGLAYFALAGLVWYLFKRFEHLLRPIKPLPRMASNPQPKPVKRGRWILIQTSIVVFIISMIYGIPEYMGRTDAAAVCETISVGTGFSTRMNELDAYRMEKKAKHGTLFAANYYPKTKESTDGNGAVIIVFLAGFPFSRAYCVLHLKEGVVESKRLMFNAEDYEYCDGEIRGVWQCSEETQK